MMELRVSEGAPPAGCLESYGCDDVFRVGRVGREGYRLMFGNVQIY